jgi:hypothetical protein
MLTDEWLESEKPHAHMDGVQRIYKFPSGWGLSVINGTQAHAFPYAWEIAVINPDEEIDYDTELTSDVAVFGTDEEANEFIERAAKLLTYDDRYQRK